MTVTCVNDPPVADPDFFDYVGNTQLEVDQDTAATPEVLATTPSTFGVLDGDSDPVENNAIAVTSITVGACTDSAGPTFDCNVAGFGAIISEVGAVMLVGGNIDGSTRVLTTAIVLETRKGAFATALALAFVLLAITFAINTGALMLQQRLARR